MAQKTFTSEQLCQIWRDVANRNGTRRDVVLGIMAIIGVADTKDTYRKVYNNVTQRVKQLSEGEPKLTFPDLTAGHKGARRAGADMAALQAILTATV